jgi:hypothetical protein
LDEIYSQMVTQIFEWAANGVSIGEITSRLREREYIVRPREIQRRTGPKQIGGKPFTWDQVKKIIQNPIYRAAIKVKQGEFPASLPRIISDELWIRANTVIKKVDRPAYKTRQNKHELLLHGLVSCGCCKGALVVHPGTSAKGREYLYYRCQNLRKNGNAVKCTVGQVPAGKLETAVITQIGHLANDPAVLEAAMDESLKARKAQLTPLKERVTTLNEQIEKLGAFYRDLRGRLLGLPKGSGFVAEIIADGDRALLERQELECKRKALLEEEAALKQQLGGSQQLRTELGRFSEIFGVMPFAKLQQAIRLLIKRIIVNRTSAGVTKSGSENIQIEGLGHKKAFSVFIDFYVKPRGPKGFRKAGDLCVSDTEMAARAGIEPVTK